jgi:hypothetical protein
MTAKYVLYQQLAATLTQDKINAEAQAELMMRDSSETACRKCSGNDGRSC